MDKGISNSNNLDSKILRKSEGLQRGMKGRHVTMIAVGGTIGTGLFLGSGYVLQNAGPGGSILAYAAGGLLMYIMMVCLGELVVAIPVSGSTQAYANELISPAAGFLAGWIRWIACAVTITSQLVASSIIMKNILPSVPSVVWIITFTLLLFFLNLFSARGYGEVEFWFVSIKVITIAIFILVAVAIVLGFIGDGAKVTKSFNEISWFTANLKTVLMTIMTASFAYGGVDLIASAAGESEDPEKNLPCVIYTVIFSLIIIYFICLLLLSFILPWEEASLNMSPFAYVLRRAGLRSAELIINVVVVTSALSSANTFIFSCTRTLWSLGRHDQAFKFLGTVNSRKVPVNALLISMVFAILALLSSFISSDVVYLFLISSVGLGNMFLYGLTCLCQYKFRKKYISGGNSIEKLKFKAPLYPVLPIAGIILYSLIVIGMALDPTQRIALYTGLPTYLFLYIIYRFSQSRKRKIS